VPRHHRGVLNASRNQGIRVTVLSSYPPLCRKWRTNLPVILARSGLPSGWAPQGATGGGGPWVRALAPFEKSTTLARHCIRPFFPCRRLTGTTQGADLVKCIAAGMGTRRNAVNSVRGGGAGEKGGRGENLWGLLQGRTATPTVASRPCTPRREKIGPKTHEGGPKSFSGASIEKPLKCGRGLAILPAG